MNCIQQYERPIRRFIACGLLCLTFPIVLSAETPRTHLRVGAYQNAPKIFVDELGRAQGILVDLLEEMARLEGWTIEYLPCEWADCLDALRSGDIDLMPDVALTEARRDQYSFHAVPALHSWLQVYANPRVPVHSLLDLDGTRVALLKGSMQQSVIENIAAGFAIRIEVIETATFDDAFALVASGQADVTVVNHFYGDYHRHDYGLTRTPVMFEPVKLYFAVAEGMQGTVLDAIDKHLSTWREDSHSFYFKTKSKWLDVEPSRFIPRAVWWALNGLVVVALLALVLSALLRREVIRRTKQLAEQNEHLKSVLGELDTARRMAVEQERLHVLGQMTGGIAHDFNNCLMLILGHSELLRMAIEEGTENNMELLAQLHVIEEAGQDGSSIVQRMREFYQTRHPDATPQPVQADALVADVIDMTRPLWNTKAAAAGIHIEIKRDLAPGPPIFGVRFELREALLNIVLNAIDAMPEGGDLSFRTSVTDSHVCISVSDTGTGMTEEEQINCLRPYFTTKADKGTGMGLSMVLDIVERHEGSINIKTSPGHGTTFSLLFPAYQEHAASTQANTAAVATARVRPLTILAVDNNARLLGLLTSLLKADNHRVYGAVTSADALLLAESHTFDVAFLDQVMPDMTGTRLLKAFRAKGYTMPVIILTGTMEMDERSSGAFRVLRKPLAIRQLRQVLLDLGFGYSPPRS